MDATIVEIFFSFMTTFSHFSKFIKLIAIFDIDDNDNEMMTMRMIGSMVYAEWQMFSTLITGYLVKFYSSSYS